MNNIPPSAFTGSKFITPTPQNMQPPGFQTYNHQHAIAAQKQLQTQQPVNQMQPIYTPNYQPNTQPVVVVDQKSSNYQGIINNLPDDYASKIPSNSKKEQLNTIPYYYVKFNDVIHSITKEENDKLHSGYTIIVEHGRNKYNVSLIKTKNGNFNVKYELINYATDYINGFKKSQKKKK